MASNSSTKLGFIEKVGYGLGDMASNFYLGFFGMFLLYYYTDIYGITPVAVATMLLVSKIIDAVTDPAMGLIADRTSSRWGKYRPYLLWVAVPYGLLGYAIFWGPDLLEGGRLFYAYLTYISVMLAFTAINVPYSALLAVISPSAEERTKATTYRFIGASLGGLMVGSLATPLVRWLGAGDDLLGFRMTMLIFAVLSVALFWITFATTRERIQPPVHESSVLTDCRELVKNVSWVVLALACIITITALVTRTASLVYYVKYYLGEDGTQVFLFMDRTATLTSMGMVGQLTGVFFTQWLVARLEKSHIVILMSVLHTGLLVTCYYVPPESFWTIVAIHFSGMASFGVTITVLFAMFTDCAEYGEWKTGTRSSGLVVSASMFALKFGSAIGGALPGFALAAVGFVANEVQTDEAMAGIRMIFNFLPATLYFIGGAALLMYRIDRKTLRKIEAELLERRAIAP